MNAAKVQKDLREAANAEIAEHSQRFFKTGPKEYGEGDQFLGIRVPKVRKVAKSYKKLPLDEVEHLLHSPYHEERLCSLFILVNKFENGDPKTRYRIYNLYRNNISYINNWDLVDSSAHKIVGPFLEERDRKILYKFAQSKNLWQRRIAIMSTLHFIKRDDYSDTLLIAKILLNDAHDLIHKAAGWMLREIGKRDIKVEEDFLIKHGRNMPRTMLRYAIEKFPDEKRKKYLAMR